MMKTNFISAMAAVMVTAAMGAGVAEAQMVTKADWGKGPHGEPVEIFTLKSDKVEARVTTFGARLVSVKTADKHGKVADVVLGYDTVAGYFGEKNPYLGAVVGRYGNRINKGKFSIDGHQYQIPPNNGGNALHGGPVGFDQHVWKATEVKNGVEMTLVSPDGDQGFPGTLTATVRYTLHGDSLRIDYTAKTDKATVVNLTNHSYFNLHGDDAGDILDQKVTLNATHFTPVNADLIPTGKYEAVRGTPLDFVTEHAIGERINADNEQLKLAGGYDHNFLLDGTQGELHQAARVWDPVSGRTLNVTTTEPGVQFYSGNFLDGTFTGRHGIAYTKHKGFCLETQHYPDSPNHPNFPTTLLKPGETMHSTTVFRFGVE